MRFQYLNTTKRPDAGAAPVQMSHRIRTHTTHIRANGSCARDSAVSAETVATYVCWPDRIPGTNVAGAMHYG